MARINTNVASLIARSNLSRANSDLDLRLERLSTGLRINRGADDPAGLIVSQRLGAEISGLEQAVRNSERASSVIATAEGALAEVADLLNSIQGLIVEAANTGALSDAERRANQLQIDSAIESITRISNSTSFGGLKLLNGELDYILSGLRTSAVSKTNIFGAGFGGQSNIQVQVETVASAQVGALYLRGDYAGGPFGNGRLQSSVTLEIAGSRGVQTFQILSGRPLSEVVAAINSFTAATGVSASLINNNVNSGVVFSSVEYGSGEFVSVKRLGGPSDGGFFRTYRLEDSSAVPASVNIPALIGSTLVESNRDAGRDVVAVVNGALGTGQGLKLSLPNASSLSLELLLSEAFAIREGEITEFFITGGGALYQLGGSVSSTQQINVGLPSIADSRLGGVLVDGQLQFLSSIKSGGSNDLNSANFEAASRIVTSAIDEISTIRGRLGALERNTLDTNVRSLQTAIENLTASQSRIRDADFAAETAALTRAQILSSASTSSLALANQQSQQVLQLLG